MKVLERSEGGERRRNAAEHALRDGAQIEYIAALRRREQVRIGRAQPVRELLTLDEFANPLNLRGAVFPQN